MANKKNLGLGDIQMAQVYLKTSTAVNGHNLPLKTAVKVLENTKFQIQIKCCLLFSQVFSHVFPCFPMFSQKLPEVSPMYCFLGPHPTSQVAANHRMAGMAKEVFSLCTYRYLAVYFFNLQEHVFVDRDIFNKYSISGIFVFNSISINSLVFLDIILTYLLY